MPVSWYKGSHCVDLSLPETLHDQHLPVQMASLPTCSYRMWGPLVSALLAELPLIKRRVNPGLGYTSFSTAQRTIQGYEAMHMLHKGQYEGLAKRDILAQNQVINQLFGLAA